MYAREVSAVAAAVTFDVRGAPDIQVHVRITTGADAANRSAVSASTLTTLPGPEDRAQLPADVQSWAIRNEVFVQVPVAAFTV